MVLEDPERRRLIIEALRAGNWQSVACEFAGVSTTAYYDTLRAAEAPDAPAWMTEFTDELKRVRAEAEVRNVQLIQQAAQLPQHWTAAAWFLERSWPDRWARNRFLQVEVTHYDARPARVKLDEALTVFAEVLEEKNRALEVVGEIAAGTAGVDSDTAA